MIPVNFTLDQFQPTLADYAREEFLRCYAQWMEGDPGHMFYPLKKPAVSLNPFNLGKLKSSAHGGRVRVRLRTGTGAGKRERDGGERR